MKKRSIELLRFYMLAKIRRWLGLPVESRSLRCPFHFDSSNHSLVHNVCHELFPKKPRENKYGFALCPCKVYSVKYVSKVAHWALGEYERTKSKGKRS